MHSLGGEGTLTAWRVPPIPKSGSFLVDPAKFTTRLMVSLCYSMIAIFTDSMHDPTDDGKKQLSHGITTE